MTAEQLRERFPNASEQFIRANADDIPRTPPRPAGDRGQAPRAEPQQVVRDAALGTAQRKIGYSGRVRIRITSYRRFLLDPDNLAGGCKYFVDCCRYSSLVRGDRAQDIEFAATQEKVRRKEDERTEVVIERIA